MVSRRQDKLSTFVLAGWLLADLLLGMAMMFFLANTAAARPPEDITAWSPPATFTLLPTYTPLPTYTLQSTQPPGSTPETIIVRVGLDPEPVVDEEGLTFNQVVSIVDNNVGDREVGLLLIYGYSSDRARGVQRARSAYADLARKIESITNRTIYYPLHWQYPDETLYKIVVFVYNENPD